ncbi:C10 family peptidase [Carboxylicivirga caseinilyticus]|uniref:C10 family peptidase n=1 Tax=Carboxylicivirga caseinilyticus TaxID=3417572 RepID=UPI003D33449F|nr:C10 family peptidase [Marinilabiliaceae bacterium A049]
MKTNKLVLYILILFLTISCSKEKEIEDSVNVIDKNFIELSLVRKIAEEVNFDNKDYPNCVIKSTSSKSTKRTIMTVNEVKNENEKTSFYVINYIEGGFIIVSADKRTTPILAFSENGDFDFKESSFPPGLILWINDTKKQISTIQNSDLEQSKKVKLAWEEVEDALGILSQSTSVLEPPVVCYQHTETVTVGPFLNSTWYQTGGFNDALPYIQCDGYNMQAFAGCVIIAMGQVMRYYEYPIDYDWASMPLTYGTSTTANFINDIHNAISNSYPSYPEYYCDGTSVYTSDMGNVLKNQFGFSSADYSNYNYKTVLNNLNNNRPVILRGDNGEVGHAWVCEGYKQTSYQFDDCT